MPITLLPRETRQVNVVLAPVPEFIEEQSLYNFYVPVVYASGLSGFPRGGQRLTVPNRTITKLGLWLSRQQYAAGAITFTIRRVADDIILNSKVWGDASQLPLYGEQPILAEVIFDNPTPINGDVYILAEYTGPDIPYDQAVSLAIMNQDVKPGEFLVCYGWWPDRGVYDYANMDSYDMAYRYTYRVE